MSIELGKKSASQYTGKSGTRYASSWVAFAHHVAGVLGLSLRFGGHPSTDGKTIWLPTLPWELIEDDKALMEGFIIHEGGHVRHSNMLAFSNFAQTNPALKNLLNALEDPWMEVAQWNTFRGARSILERRCDILRERGMVRTGAASAMEALCVTAFSAAHVALGRHDFRDDLQAAKQLLQQHLGEGSEALVEAVEALVTDRIGYCRSTEDAIQLTLDIVELLKQEADKADQEQQQPNGSGDQGDESNPDDEQSSEGKGGAGSDAGDQSQGADSSDSQGDGQEKSPSSEGGGDSSETDASADESGGDSSQGGGATGQDDASASDGDSAGDSADQAGESDAGGAGPEGSSGAEKGKSGQSSGEAGETLSNAPGGSSSGSDNDGSPSKEGSGTTNNGASQKSQSGTQQPDNQATSNGREGSTEEGAGSSMSEKVEAMLATIDEDGEVIDVRKAIEELARAIANGEIDEYADAALVPETDSSDEGSEGGHSEMSGILVPKADADAARLLRARCTRAASVLASRLELFLESQVEEDREFCDRGKMVGSRLWRTAVNDVRIFSRTERITLPRAAVSVLADLSMSMAGRPATLTAETMMLLAETMQNVGNPHELLGFGDASNHLLTVFKHFDEDSLTGVNRIGALQACVGGGTPMVEGLFATMGRLGLRPEEKRVCFILTDGSPYDYRGVVEQVAMAEADGIPVVMFLIDMSSVPAWIEQAGIRYVLLKDVSDLAGSALTMLGQLLINN